MQGTIIKGISGFYYVKINDKIIECKARGKFRFDELTPMVGDNVEIVTNGDKGTIEKILPRHTELFRPAVANVTQAFVVFSLKNPDLHIDLLNKFLLLCEYNDLKIIVCLNKLDLLKDEAELEVIDMIEKAGYAVIFLRAKENIGISELQEKLEGNITVLCGPSGVGKSTILNKLVGREAMETGEISERLGRGKHTTRHSELIDLHNGFLVDTPGFSSLDMEFISKEKLQFCFPEFSEYLGCCKFKSCVHHKEPQCAIKEAVKNKNISEGRYAFYIKTLEELSNGRTKR